MKEQSELSILKELIKIIVEKQNESLKNMNQPNNKDYWFGRTALCSELLKAIKYRWNNKI